MSDRDATLAEAINSAVALGTRGIYTCAPAKVVKWDASKQRADCQILVQNVTEGEEGERQVRSWPVVPGVPVQFMGAGEYRMTVPISDGSGNNAATTGLLIFSHLSLDKWLSGDGGEVDPEFDHDHALGDAIFIPGLVPFGAPWSDVPTEGMSIGKDGGLQMKVTDDLITFAETTGNAQFVALENKVGDELNKIASALSNLTAPPGGGTCTGNTYTTPGSVAASKVKAE